VFHYLLVHGRILSNLEHLKRQVDCVPLADNEPRPRALEALVGADPRIRGSSELAEPPLYSRRDLTDYLAQVLSAFKAASAEAFVV
jgi:hypothetical protein